MLSGPRFHTEAQGAQWLQVFVTVFRHGFTEARGRRELVFAKLRRQSISLSIRNWRVKALYVCCKSASPPVCRPAPTERHGFIKAKTASGGTTSRNATCCLLNHVHIYATVSPRQRRFLLCETADALPGAKFRSCCKEPCASNSIIWDSR